MKHINKKNISIIMAVLVFLTLVSFLYNGHKVALAKKDMVIAEKNEIIDRVSQKSELELIQDEIKYAEEEKEFYAINLEEAKKGLEQANKVYESSIWYKRCLEIKGELVLKQIDNTLMCYESVSSMGDFIESNYNDLEKFATYNIDKTREDLGL